MKRMAEVGWRKRAAMVLPLGMYGHQVGFIRKDKDNDLPPSGLAGPFHIRHFKLQTKPMHYRLSMTKS